MAEVTFAVTAYVDPPRRRVHTPTDRGVPRVKTKAAVVIEPGKRIEIEELDLDKPQEGEVLIRYTYAGLCHSDVHVAHGDPVDVVVDLEDDGGWAPLRQVDRWIDPVDVDGHLTGRATFELPDDLPLGWHVLRARTPAGGRCCSRTPGPSTPTPGTSSAASGRCGSRRRTPR